MPADLAAGHADEHEGRDAGDDREAETIDGVERRAREAAAGRGDGMAQRQHRDGQAEEEGEVEGVEGEPEGVAARGGVGLAVDGERRAQGPQRLVAEKGGQAEGQRGPRPPRRRPRPPPFAEAARLSARRRPRPRTPPITRKAIAP